MSSTARVLGPLPRLTESVALDVVRHLKRHIVTGILAPGEALPGERSLALDLGVSRTALREGLRQLQSQGLIESKHGSGSRVTETPRGSAQLVAELSADDRSFAESAELRALVEPRIARLAAERADSRHLRDLRTIMESAIAAGDSTASTALDIEFHLGIAEAAGNSLLSSLSQLTVTWTINERVRSHLDERGRAISHAGHARILDAIEAKDAAGAEQAMTDHLAEIGAIIDATREP